MVRSCAGFIVNLGTRKSNKFFDFCGNPRRLNREFSRAFVMHLKSYLKNRAKISTPFVFNCDLLVCIKMIIVIIEKYRKSQLA